MVAGSVTIAAYFVTGRAIAMMSAFLVAELSAAAAQYEATIIVSRLTCPDTTIIGSESTNAPNTPVSAFVPPGPVVTCTARPAVEQPRVALRGDRARLLVMVRQTSACPRSGRTASFRCIAPPPVTMKTCVTPRAATR